MLGPEDLLMVENLCFKNIWCQVQPPVLSHPSHDPGGSVVKTQITALLSEISGTLWLTGWVLVLQCGSLLCDHKCCPCTRARKCDSWQACVRGLQGLRAGQPEHVCKSWDMRAWQEHVWALKPETTPGEHHSQVWGDSSSCDDVVRIKLAAYTEN